MGDCTKSGIAFAIFIILALSMFPSIIGMTEPSERYTTVPAVPEGTYEGIHWFTNAHNVTPTTTGAWVGVDVSAHIPVDFVATGVVVSVHDYGAGTPFIDIRTPGSTDDFSAVSALYGTGYTMGFAGINSTGHFECYRGHLLVHVFLLGLTDGSVTYFTNVIDKSTANVGVWEDVDVSANVTSTAVGVVIRFQPGLATYDAGQIREVGSTDNRIVSYKMPKAWYFTVVGLNSTHCFQQYIGAVAADLYIVGYIIGESFVYYLNDIDVSLGVSGSWQDIDATGNETGVICEIFSSGLFKGITRQAGSTDDRYANAKFFADTHIYYGCGLNTTEYFQGEVEGAGVDTFISAYTQDYIYQPYEASYLIDDWSNVAGLISLIPLFYALGVVVVSALWIDDIRKCGME